jgi:hypothetical protein
MAAAPGTSCGCAAVSLLLDVMARRRHLIHDALLRPRAVLLPWRRHSIQLAWAAASLGQRWCRRDPGQWLQLQHPGAPSPAT